MLVVPENEEGLKVFLRDVRKVVWMEELTVMFESGFLFGDFKRFLREPIGKE